MHATNLNNIFKHQDLIAEGKKSALYFHTKTGEMRALFTISSHGVEGAGTPPGPQTDMWLRIQ